jgi:hypothetical protein
MNEPTVKLPICLYCGTPASPGEGYCRNCGNALVPPTIASPPSASSLPPTRLGQSPPPSASSLPPTRLGQSPLPPPQTPTMTAHIPSVPPLNPTAGAYSPPAQTIPRKRRSPLLIGCLVFIGLAVVVVGAGGIYVWRATTYSPPSRKAPDIPQTASGTMTEFPVDNDPVAPARPTSVQTESLGATAAKSSGSTPAKLPPGVDRSSLSKGATTMTTSVYKPKPKSTAPAATGQTGNEIYINVLTAMPNQPTFLDGLVSSVMKATNGTRTGVNLQSPQGEVYTGSKIRSAASYVYILAKQASDVVIMIYSPDPSMQDVVDRLARNVGNAGGLVDYPEIKDALWTLPSTTPPELTMVDFNTLTGEQIESWVASGGGDDTQKILSQMRPFIPAQLTNTRYLDGGRREWVALNFQYESSFQAWRTWLLARSALGLGGAQTITVRDVTAVYLDSDGQKILVFQKGPYLIFLGGPSGASLDLLVALGNQFQV